MPAIIVHDHNFAVENQISPDYARNRPTTRFQEPLAEAVGVAMPTVELHRGPGADATNSRLDVRRRATVIVHRAEYATAVPAPLCRISLRPHGFWIWRV